AGVEADGGAAGRLRLLPPALLVQGDAASEVEPGVPGLLCCQAPKQRQALFHAAAFPQSIRQGDPQFGPQGARRQVTLHRLPRATLPPEQLPRGVVEPPLPRPPTHAGPQQPLGQTVLPPSRSARTTVSRPSTGSVAGSSAAASRRSRVRSAPSPASNGTGTS